jgi:fumarate reductase subunit C
VSGLVLVLFMWAHLFAVSSILLGKDAMYRVTRFFEGSLFFSEPQPWLVSLVALAIFLIFALHTLLALRKIPDGIPAVAGLAPAHARHASRGDQPLAAAGDYRLRADVLRHGAPLRDCCMHPADIGPHASAARMCRRRVALLGLVLLLFRGTARRDRPLSSRGEVGLVRCD